MGLETQWGKPKPSNPEGGTHWACRSGHPCDPRHSPGRGGWFQLLGATGLFVLNFLQELVDLLRQVRPSWRTAEAIPRKRWAARSLPRVEKHRSLPLGERTCCPQVSGHTKSPGPGRVGLTTSPADAHVPRQVAGRLFGMLGWWCSQSAPPKIQLESPANLMEYSLHDNTIARNT